MEVEKPMEQRLPDRLHQPRFLHLTKEVTQADPKDRFLAVESVPVEVRSNFYSQKEISGNNILPLLGIEVRQKSVSWPVKDVSGAESTL